MTTREQIIAAFEQEHGRWPSKEEMAVLLAEHTDHVALCTEGTHPISRRQVMQCGAKHREFDWMRCTQPMRHRGAHRMGEDFRWEDTLQESVRCPVCGDPIDYCEGHGQLGDPDGFYTLGMHDSGDHVRCHPLGCDQAPLK